MKSFALSINELQDIENQQVRHPENQQVTNLTVNLLILSEIVFTWQNPERKAYTLLGVKHTHETYLTRYQLITPGSKLIAFLPCG